MIVAVEDQVSEAVARVLLRDFQREGEHTVIGGRGRTHLEKIAGGLNRTAQHLPTLILVDQDRVIDCPPGLVERWFGGRLSPRLLFQVATFEVESWLLADSGGIATLLGIPRTKVPDKPDELPDPKRKLIDLARRCKVAEIRDDLVPREGSTAAVGPAYNPRVVDFVAHRWNPSAAAQRSPSLARAVRRLSAMV